MAKLYLHKLLVTSAAALIASLAISPTIAQNPANSRITVNPDERFQTIDGFGVNFNGTYFRDTQKPMIDMLIDDLGATLFRLDPYGLLNWEEANDNDDPEVMNWEYYNDRYSIPTFEASWAAARYLNSRGIRPLLALSGIAPAWMLDSDASPPRHQICGGSSSMGHTGPMKPNHLNPAMYEEFAEEVVSLAIYARTRAHIDFQYFGPLNETDCYPAEGPRVDPDEMPKLLSVVARRMQKEGLGDVKLVVAEQAIASTDYIGLIMQDPELMKQVGVFAFHTYGSESVGPQVERVHASKHATTPVWLTEYGDLKDLDRSAENEWTGFSVAATQRALRALNQGARAALYWDAYDNYHEHYPRLTFYGLIKNADHVYTPKKRYYAAKQLYKFVRPRSQRIAASADSVGLTVSAFRDDRADELVLVGVKQGAPDHILVALPSTAPQPAQWELYQTTRTLDCVKTGMAPIRNGVAEINLPDEAIFTLVGRLGKH
jgi:O-glycosyl hydrolase